MRGVRLRHRRESKEVKALVAQVTLGKFAQEISRNKRVFTQRSCFLKKTAVMIVVYSEEPNQGLGGVEVGRKKGRTEADATYIQLKIVASAPGSLRSDFFILNSRQNSSGEKIKRKLAS